MLFNLQHLRVAAVWAVATLAVSSLFAQVTDTTATTEEEDFSQYDNLTFADKGAKNYCTSKIPGLVPQKLVSLGYDFQAGAAFTADTLGGRGLETIEALAHGMRLSANIPVISNYKGVWQLGATYWETRYQRTDNGPAAENPFHQNLLNRTLRTLGLNTTVFKPFNEKRFLLVQASADLNGDYTFSDFQDLGTLRYSAAALYGFKPNDRLMWGLGLARTYRVGEVNLIPVVLYNWTSEDRKWGTEILFPARGHVRRNFNPRTILLGGWELEGNTYRLNGLAGTNNLTEPELRRGEARLRLVLERQISGFVWLSAQAGWRYNWSFNVDEGEFFRGFFGDQPYQMENVLGNPLYFNISVNLVSP